MAKYVFTTMQTESTTYDAPSGQRYVFYKGQPTEVSSVDESFFENNKRFEKASRRAKHEPKPSAETILSEELSQIKGVSKATAEKVADVYLTREELVGQLKAGFELSVEGIPVAQANKITTHYQEEE